MTTSYSKESTHVGPIIFSNRVARSQLLNHGEVVTYRSSERTTGETWWRMSRTGEKMGDVTVEGIGECNPAILMNLWEYRDLSGFETAAEWQEAIVDLHGGDLPHEGFLYRATAVEGDCVKCGKTAPLPTNDFCPPCGREEGQILHESRVKPR